MELDVFRVREPGVDVDAVVGLIFIRLLIVIHDDDLIDRSSDPAQILHEVLLVLNAVLVVEIVRNGPVAPVVQVVEHPLGVLGNRDGIGYENLTSLVAEDQSMHS